MSTYGGGYLGPRQYNSSSSGRKYLLINLDYFEDTPMGNVPEIMSICDTKQELFKTLRDTLIAFGYEDDEELMSCRSYDELVPIVEADEDIMLRVWEWSEK